MVVAAYAVLCSSTCTQQQCPLEVLVPGCVLFFLILALECVWLPVYTEGARQQSLRRVLRSDS